MAKAKTKKRDAATGVSAGLTPMRPCTELCKSSWTKAQNADPILELEHDIDFVSPQGGSESKAAEETVAAKKRIAWGSCSDSSLGRPIPGLEYLWSNDHATDEDPTVFHNHKEIDGILDNDTRQRKKAYELLAKDNAKPSTSSSQTQGRPKKRQARFEASAEDADDEYAEEDNVELSMMPRAVPTESLYIANFDALVSFYRQRFDDLTMKPLRKIITEWIKRLEPQRCTKYGGYDNLLPTERPQGKTPIWWPSDCPYREPAHLKREHLIPLAADIMLIHRRVDELCGKRKRPWINQLRKQAHYIVDSMPTETFSSSKGDVFNDAMKDRALKEILPSLFDIATTHEEYVTQFGLFEGTGKQDPLKGKTVTWKRLPRPLRGAAHKNKRQCRYMPVTFAPQEFPAMAERLAEETDPDETMSAPSTTFSSFQASNESRDAGSEMKQECSPSPTPLPSVPISHTGRRESRSPKKEQSPAFGSASDQSLYHLRLAGMQDADIKPIFDDQIMQFPNSNAITNASFQAMEGIVPLPVSATVPFPFQADMRNGLCGIQQSNGLPLDNRFSNVQQTLTFPAPQLAYDEVQLPFGSYAHGGGPRHYMGGLDPPMSNFLYHGELSPY